MRKSITAALVIAAAATLIASGCASADAATKPIAKPQTSLASNQLVVIGDSYSSGYLGYGIGADGWPQRFADAEGLTLTLNAIPGTGYVKTSSQGINFASRWRTGLTATTGVVIVAGSQNDKNEDPAAVYSKAAATYKAIKIVSPDAVIIAVGPMWGNSAPVAAQPVEDAVKAAATAAGIQFIDGSDWLTPYPWDVVDGHPNNGGHGILFARIRDTVVL